MRVFSFIAAAALTVGLSSGVSAQEVGEFYVGGGGFLGASLTEYPASFHVTGAQGFAGYNLLSGSVLFGAEARFSSDLTPNVLSNTFVPFQQSPSSSGSGSGPPPFGVPSVPGTYSVVIPDNTQLSFTTEYYDSLKSLASGSVVGRMGMRVEDMTYYAVVGGGVAFMRRYSYTATTDRVDCTQANATVTVHNVSGSYSYATTSCASSAPGADSIYESTFDQIAPVATVGLGIEKHWGQMFARAELAMTHTFFVDTRSLGGMRGLTKYDLSAAVGVRF